MLAVTVEFLHGIYAASSPDDIAITGRDDPGEWPPSPARVFSAFVAADGTRERMRLTDGAELRVLEIQPPPVIVADPPDDVVVNTQWSRFVPVDARAKGAVQEYVARKSTPVRPAPRISPRVPEVTYIWPELDVSDRHFAALRVRAARVGYIGTAASPVRVRVARDHGPSAYAASQRAWHPDKQGAAHLPVPFPGMIDVLDDMFDDFSAGSPTRRSWYRAERAAYRPPGGPVAVAGPDQHMIWLLLEKSVAGRHALHVSTALRGAILSAFEAQAGGAEVPPVLHGHGFGDDEPYDHVSWLVLPDAGFRHSTGRIHGVAVRLPADTPAEVLERVRAAAWHTRHLNLTGGRTVGIEPHQQQRRPWAAHPQRWCGPAQRWMSVLPVVHERWTKRAPDLAEIARWCRHAGLPAPTWARLSRPPLLPGGVSLMPHEAARDNGERRPYSHLELKFAQDVAGPVALGKLRHFGLGLMAPRQVAPAHKPDEAMAEGSGT